MGGRLSNEQSTSDIGDQYKMIKVINDPRYGEGRLLEQKNDKKMILMKEITVTEEEQFKRWQKKLEIRNFSRCENIIKVLQHYQTKDKLICSSLFKIYILFEYVPESLHSAINKQKQKNMHFPEDVLYKFTTGAINGLSVFQENKVPHQNIRAQTLSVKGNPESDSMGLILKICDTPLLTSLTQFAAVSQDFSEQLKGHYLSPILVQAVQQQNYNPTHNPYKSDVFSLGMTLLSAALLEQLDNCYQYNQGIIDESKLEDYLQRADQIYSGRIMLILRDMIKIKEEERPDFASLQRLYFHHQLENLHVQVLTSQAAEDITTKKASGFNEAFPDFNSPFQDPSSLVAPKNHNYEFEAHSHPQHLDDFEFLPLKQDQPDVLPQQPYLDIPSLGTRLDVQMGAITRSTEQNIAQQHRTFQSSVQSTPKKLGNSYNRHFEQSIQLNSAAQTINKIFIEDPSPFGDQQSNFILEKTEPFKPSSRLTQTSKFSQTSNYNQPIQQLKQVSYNQPQNPQPFYQSSNRKPLADSKTDVDLLIEKYNRQYNSSIAPIQTIRQVNNFSGHEQKNHNLMMGTQQQFKEDNFKPQRNSNVFVLESSKNYNNDLRLSDAEKVRQLISPKFTSVQQQNIQVREQTQTKPFEMDQYNATTKQQFYSQNQNPLSKPFDYESFRFRDSNLKMSNAEIFKQTGITSKQTMRLSNQLQNSNSNNNLQRPSEKFTSSQPNFYPERQSDAYVVGKLLSPSLSIQNTYQRNHNNLSSPLLPFQVRENFLSVESYEKQNDSIRNQTLKNSDHFKKEQIKQSGVYNNKFSNQLYYAQPEQQTFRPTTNSRIEIVKVPVQQNNSDQRISENSYSTKQNTFSAPAFYGTQRFDNGGYYEGYIKDGKLHGTGTLYYANGKPAYEGQWMNDKFEGHGTLYNDQVEITSKVDYRNLETIGGCWIKYVGSFVDDCRHGYGTIYLANGERFEGNFYKDDANGPGTFYKKNQLIPGFWKNNQYQ